MKKFISIFLISVAFLSLYGCGKSGKQPSATPTQLPPSPTPSATATVKPTQPAVQSESPNSTDEILEEVADIYVNENYFDSLKKTKSAVKSFPDGIFVSISKEEETGEYTVHQGTFHEGGYFYEEVSDVTPKGTLYEITCTSADSPAYCKITYDSSKRNYPKYCVRDAYSQAEKNYTLMRMNSFEHIDACIASVVFGNTVSDQCSLTLNTDGELEAEYNGKTYIMSVSCDTGNGEAESMGYDGQLCLIEASGTEDISMDFYYRVNKDQITVFDENNTQVMLFKSK